MNPGYIVLGVLVVLLFITLFSNFQVKVVEEVPLSQEESERIVQSRANLLNNICDTVGDAWDLSRDDINTNMELMPGENTLVTMIYRNNLLRIFIYWNSKKVQVNLTRKFNNRTSKIYKKSFSLYKKNMLEDVFKYLEKYKPAKEEIAAEDEEKVAAVKEAIVEKLGEAIEQMIDEKVQEKLAKILEQLEENEDHE